MPRPGYRAPYIRVFFKNEEVTIKINRFRYVYSEEEDDICELDVRGDDKDLADHPAFELHSELEIVWGYIGEPRHTNTRRVYVQDAKWSYAEEVSGSIVCTDKAKSLSFDNSPQMGTNSTLPDIAKKVADKHGLELNVGVLIPETGLVSVEAGKIETAEEKAKRENVKHLNQVFPGYDLWKKNYNKSDTWKYNSQVEDVKDITDRTHLDKNFNIYKAIPNGALNMRAYLEMLAMREKGGNTVIDTRDNKIIIRERNFAQRPFKSYNYKREPNEVVEFAPEYRNRRRSAASGLDFTGWDPANKEFFVGSTDASSGNQTDALSRLQQMAEYLKTLDQRAPAGTFKLNPLNGKLRYRENLTEKVFTKPGALVGGASAEYSKAESVTNFKDVSFTKTVADDLEALQRAIANQQNFKGVYDPTSANPYDAFTAAANAREAANLNRNPGTLRIEGDPAIEVGIVVTMLGVAKKHMGNYYVIESEHEIAGDAYYTEMQLVRDGNNYKQKDGIDVTKYGKRHNNTKGRNDPERVKKVKNKDGTQAK